MYGRMLPLYNAALLGSRMSQQMLGESEGFDVNEWRRSAPVGLQNAMYLGNGKWSQGVGRFAPKTLAIDLPYRLLTQPGARPSVSRAITDTLGTVSPIVSSLGYASQLATGSIPENAKTHRQFYDESDPFITAFLKSTAALMGMYLVPGQVERFATQTLSAKNGVYETKSGRSYDLPDRLLGLAGFSRHGIDLGKARKSVLNTIPNALLRKYIKAAKDKKDPSIRKEGVELRNEMRATQLINGGR
jgi:hypothetical protein